MIRPYLSVLILEQNIYREFTKAFCQLMGSQTALKKTFKSWIPTKNILNVWKNWGHQEKSMPRQNIYLREKSQGLAYRQAAMQQSREQSNEL